METHDDHATSVYEKNVSLRTIRRIATPRIVCDFIFFMVLYVVCIFSADADSLRHSVCLLCVVFLYSVCSTVESFACSQTFDGCRGMALSVLIWVATSYVYLEMDCMWGQWWLILIRDGFMSLFMLMRFVPFHMVIPVKVAVSVKPLAYILFKMVLFAPLDSSNTFSNGPGSMSARFACLLLIMYVLDLIRESIELELGPWMELLFMFLSMPLYMSFYAFPLIVMFLVSAVGVLVFNREYGRHKFETVKQTETESVTMFSILDSDEENDTIEITLVPSDVTGSPSGNPSEVETDNACGIENEEELWDDLEEEFSEMEHANAE